MTPDVGEIVLESIVGSTLHGLVVDDGLEDLDLMAVCIEPRENLLGFSRVDTWVERTKPEGVRSEAGDTDRVVYGLRKFLGLALKGNPTILLPLFAPESFLKKMTVVGNAIRLLAPAIISKQAYHPFRGYMVQQRMRLLGIRGQKRCTRPELVERHGFDTKYAGHLIRLGMQGVELLRTGRLTLPMAAEDRSTCLAIRRGEVPLAMVEKMSLDLEMSLAKALVESPLRDYPDARAVESMMIHVYSRSIQAGEIG